MIAAHGTRAVAIATLATLVVLDEIVFWVIPVVAFVEGAGGAVFAAASAGAFKAVVRGPSSRGGRHRDQA